MFCNAICKNEIIEKISEFTVELLYRIENLPRYKTNLNIVFD